ncbi:MAG: hypothetical protein J6P60_05520 [Lachnospiraceae bacterium]|nr:hypothetical protein [Lachnospiraceae bacterium]
MSRILQIAGRTGCAFLDLILLPFLAGITCIQIVYHKIISKEAFLTIWKKEWKAFLPTYLFDSTLLSVLRVMAVFGGSKKESVIANYENNRIVWQDEDLQRKLFDEQRRYLEYQSRMNTLSYGTTRPGLDRLLFGGKETLNAGLNSCEVIAVYNALTALEDNVQTSFPELLSYFERKGMVLSGYFGTAPDSIHAYLRKHYQTKMIIGRWIRPESLQKLAAEYTVFIMTVYNDKTDITKEIHTMCITAKNGRYHVHNSGMRSSFKSLSLAIESYNDKKARPICVIGIRSEAG